MNELLSNLLKILFQLDQCLGDEGEFCDESSTHSGDICQPVDVTGER